MLKTTFLLIVLSWVAAGSLKAQDSGLSRGEALNRARQNNLRMKLSGLTVRKAKSAYQMTNSLFLPNVAVTHTFISTNNPLSSFGFLLKQEIVTQEDFNPDHLNDPGESHNFETHIEAEQPLFNADGIYKRKAAREQYQAALLGQQQEKNQLDYSVNITYDRVLLCEKVIRISRQTLATANEILRTARANYGQGLIRKTSVLDAEVLVSERRLQLRQAQAAKDQVSDQLNNLLGDSPGTPLKLTDSLTVPSSYDPPDSAFLNPNGRPDLQALAIQLEAAKNIRKARLMNWMPSLNAFGTYEWNDSHFAGSQASNYLVGVKFKWQLFSGYRQISAVKLATIAASYAHYQQIDSRNQSQLKITQTVRELRLNVEKIRSARLAGKQAHEALRIRTDRFRQGLEKTTDLLQTESLANQKQLQYIQSIFAYQEAFYRLQYLTGHELNP